MASEMTGRDRRIPSLDGLRALAVSLVILRHATASFGSAIPAGSLLWFLCGRGGDGVAIFFVISGFLITTLLLREEERNGRISLSSFYIRRIFRILPPFYTFLLFLMFFGMTHRMAIWSALLSSMFFVYDYWTPFPFWGVEHTWSLAVEEQFYLLWPPLVVGLLFWLGSRRGRKAAGMAALVLVVASPLLRLWQMFYGPAALAHREPYMLHTRLDGLMCGCLLALTIGTPFYERVYAVAAKTWWLWPICFLGLNGYLETRLGAIYMNLAGYSLNALAVTLFLAWAIRNPQSIAGQLLNWRPVVAVGVLSYSLYLWQTFLLHETRHAMAGRHSFVVMAIVAALEIMAAALLSYWFIERPSLRLRDRLLRWREKRELLRG